MADIMDLMKIFESRIIPICHAAAKRRHCHGWDGWEAITEIHEKLHDGNPEWYLEKGPDMDRLIYRCADAYFRQLNRQSKRIQPPDGFMYCIEALMRHGCHPFENRQLIEGMRAAHLLVFDDATLFDDTEYVEYILEILDAQDRDLLKKYYGIGCERLSMGEIAKRMGKSRQAIQKRISRLIQYLRQEHSDGQN